MSFFKDFKEDFSQAVNELTPGEERKGREDELVVNTLEQEVDAKAELNKLEGLFEKVEEPVVKRPASMQSIPQTAQRMEKAQAAQKAAPEPVRQEAPVPAAEEQPESAAEEFFENAVEEAPEVQEIPEEDMKEEMTMNTEEVREEVQVQTMEMPKMPTGPKEVSEEIAIITAGTSLTGNMESSGSIEVRGQINGNVQCNGKLTVTGTVRGNSVSSEFFADAAKIEGEITTDGTVKIGLGSVVIGNISATSAVIAGAIKGDIDVQGPVVVDTSAVVMGNIKSRSVQINNGAVIEGFCSQCYAEVDVNKLFDE